MRTWLFHDIKYEGTSSNKIIAANRTEEKYQTYPSTLQKRNIVIAAKEKKNKGQESDGTKCHKPYVIYRVMKWMEIALLDMCLSLRLNVNVRQRLLFVLNKFTSILKDIGLALWYFWEDYYVWQILCYFWWITNNIENGGG